MAGVHIGTSGFAYPEWRPDFYPEKLPQREFLSYYASKLSAVEIDATFYRMPRPTTLDNWRETTHENFRFALKAPRKITHRDKLAVPSEALAYWTGLLPRLGDRLGMVLYQLPPYLLRDDHRLEAFLCSLDPSPPVAFEFRHRSWFVPKVFEILRAHAAALCIHDADEGTSTIQLTAPRTYLRLRREEYGPAEQREWLLRVLGWAEQGIEVYAFFKHEGPQAPAMAVELTRATASSS
jgi:uncharacterized protein YecE (DUF72 family)